MNGKRLRRGRLLLRVARAPGSRSRGILCMGPLSLPVALGRSGIKANKFEGDGATPRGRFRLMRLWWRADRMPRPRTSLPARAIRRDDAWCENPADRRYNRAIRLSRSITADRLWRDDHLYDIVIEIDHNTRPRVARRGSAVFIHAARPGLAPTIGCIALETSALKRLLASLPARTMIAIG